MGAEKGPGAMGHGPMMGGGPMSPRMGAPALAASPQGASGSAPLAPDAKTALLRALEEEYRAEALYDAIATKFGVRAPFQRITQSERRHAWILESLAMAHGLELPADNAAAAKQPEVVSIAAACRAGVESEKKTIALYDDVA